MVNRTEEITSEGASFNRLFTNSTLPVWFQDFLINSLATQPKMGVVSVSHVSLSHSLPCAKLICHHGTQWVTRQCAKCQQHTANPNANRARLQNGRLPGRTANGRYRTYEAFSGCDLDPVHVSDYHQIPYATHYPSLTMNTIFTGWAEMQLPTNSTQPGMVQEVLASMGSPIWIDGVEHGWDDGELYLSCSLPSPPPSPFLFPSPFLCLSLSLCLSHCVCV